MNYIIMVVKKNLLGVNVESTTFSDDFIQSNFDEVRNRDLMLSSSILFNKFSKKLIKE